MSASPLSQEDAALLADAVRRGAVRITLRTRGAVMPGGPERLAAAERLRDAGLLERGGGGEHGASREDEAVEFTPTAAGRAYVAGG